MNHLEENKLRKKKVIDLLRETAEYYQKSIDNQSQASAFSKLADETESGKFAITVVGEYSAGKSTFLNALMKERYLPAYTGEATATVNFLRSVSESPTGKQMIRINYRDGKQETDNDVSLETIQKYVCTRGINVAKNISSVEVFLDSPFLNDGVTLVDSPGLNGIKESHEDITMQQIKESHAVIYMFRSNQPGSKSDFGFLSNLLKSCNTLFYVLNRIDEIKKSEGETAETVTSYLKEQCRKMLPNARIPKIWPVAAYPALVARSKEPMDYNGKEQHTDAEKAKYLADSRIEKFEERLMRFLTQGEKNRKALVVPLNKIKTILEDQAHTLESDIAILSQETNSEEVSKQIEAIESELNEINERINKGKSSLKTKINKILSNTTNAIKGETKEIRDNYLNKIDPVAVFEELARDYQRYMRKIVDEYQAVYENAMQSVNNEFTQLLLEEYGEYIDKIEQHLNENSKSDTSLSLPRISIDFTQYETDVNIDEFIQRKKELREELSKIEDKTDDIEEQIIRLDAQEKAYERLKVERKEIIAERDRRLAALGIRPEAIERTETVYERRWKFFLFIPISSSVQPETRSYIDKSNQETYDKRRIEIEDSYASELDEINAQLKQYPPSSQGYKSQLAKIERKRKEKEDAIAALNDEMKAVIDKARENNMKRAKRDLEDALDDFDKKGRDEIIKQLKEQEKAMRNTAEFILRTTLEDTLAKKQQERNTLRETLEGDVAQRAKSIEQKNQQKDDALQIAKRAETLLSEIESEKTDVIETETA